MVSSYKRGCKIIYENSNWIYADTGEAIDIERPCKRCKRLPTKEGYDFCMGYILGAESVCCGHGVEKAFIRYKEEK